MKHQTSLDRSNDILDWRRCLFSYKSNQLSRISITQMRLCTCNKSKRNRRQEKNMRHAMKEKVIWKENKNRNQFFNFQRSFRCSWIRFKKIHDFPLSISKKPASSNILFMCSEPKNAAINKCAFLPLRDYFGEMWFLFLARVKCRWTNRSIQSHVSLLGLRHYRRNETKSTEENKIEGGK